MASIADLTAAVAANTTAIQAAIAFIQANPPGQVPQELIDQLTAADAQLTAATTPVA